MTSNLGHKLTVLPVYDRVEDELQRRARAGEVVDTESVVTLSRFIDALAQSGLKNAGPTSRWAGRRFASPAELAVLRRRVVEDARRSGVPGQETLLRARGLPRLLAGFFDACAEGRVEPDELSAFVQETGQKGFRLGLLAELYRSYRDSLAKADVLDDTDRLRIAEEVARDTTYQLPPLLSGVSRLEIRDVFDWSAARLSIVVGLAKRLRSELGPPERVRLLLPYSHDGHNLFHHMERALREIEGHPDLPVEVVFCPLEDLDRPPARVGSLLFQETDQRELSDAVSFRATPGGLQEARSVARDLLDLLRDGVEPDDIAVALRRPEADWQSLADQLTTYGVPWRYRRGARLAETPLFRHVSGLLEAVVDGLPRDAMVRLLTSAFSPRRILLDDSSVDHALPPESDDEEGPVYAADDRVAAILKAAGVRDLATGAEDGRTGYHVRLESYLARVRPSESTMATDPVQADLFAPDRRSRWYELQQRQVRAILDRVDVLGNLVRRRSVPDWANSIARLLRHRDFDPRRSLGAARMAAPEAATPTQLDARTLSAQALNHQSVDALERVLRELAQSPESTHLTLGPGGFRSLLADIAHDISLNPTGARGGAVAIVSIRQLVGAGYRHVFIPHVNEGSFPASPRIDPLFKDRERTAFNRWRRAQQQGRPTLSAFPIEEPQPDEERVPVRRSEETLLLALALGACKEQVHISWSTRDSVGRPQLPSLFVEALRTATGAEVTSEPLEILPDVDHLVTREELTELSLRRTDVLLTGVGSEAWQQIALRANDSAWWAEVAGRARVELARSRFFEQPNGGEVLRTSGPDTVDPQLWRYLGYLDRGPLTRWLREDRFAFDNEKPASSSRFERYGQCPARFFYGDVLGLQPDESVNEEMDATAKGTLVHEVADRLYDEVIAAEAADLRAFLDRLGDDDAKERFLDRLMKASVARLHKEKHFGHPLLLTLSWKQLRQSLLAALDEWAKEGGAMAGVPAEREWKFGYEPENALAVPLGDGRTVCFKGRVDRVDRTESGELVVTDYKLGKVTSASYKKKVDEVGLHRAGFQLSLYALAALRLFEGFAPSGVRARFFGFKDCKSNELDWTRLRRVFADLVPDGLKSDDELEEGELSLQQGIRAVMAGIDGGSFAPATRDCSFCDFTAQCRVPNRIKNGGWET